MKWINHKSLSYMLLQISQIFLVFHFVSLKYNMIFEADRLKGNISAAFVWCLTVGSFYLNVTLRFRFVKRNSTSHLSIHDLPLHLSPLPMKPLLHEQVLEPTVFLHFAFLSHPPFFLRHSFISGITDGNWKFRKNLVKHTYDKVCNIKRLWIFIWTIVAAVTLKTSWVK